MIHVFTVADRFDIAGRVVALTPGIPVSRIAEFQAEKKAELRRPDGSILEVDFTIPHVSPYDPKRPFSITIPAPLKKEDIPVGTEVWMNSK
jgi:hypothetical protein